MNPSKIALAALLGLSAYGALQAQEVSTGGGDVSAVIARLDAMDAGPVAEFPGVKMKAEAAYAVAPYARVKWSGQNMLTDSGGKAVITVPAGRMTTGLSVSGLVVHTAGAFATPTVTAVGSPAAGYTVTILFKRGKESVTVPAVVVGAGAVNLSLYEAQASTGVVSFDIGFTEPDVIGG